MLLGAIAAAAGEPEEALDLFRQAMDLDPDYLDAYLYAAEVAIHPLGHFDHAIELCDEAEELAADGPEEMDVILLRAEALVAAGRMEDARREAARIPRGPALAPAAVYALRAGRVMLDVGDAARAKELLEQALVEEDLRPDAHYFLGLTLELENRPREALEHFLLARELDSSAPDPPWAVSAEEFARMTREALETVKPPLAERLRDVPFGVLELPPPELVAEGVDPRSMVYLSAVADAAGRAASHGGGEHRSPTPRIAHIFVYQRNVERFARSAGEVCAELSLALQQEAEGIFASEQDARPEAEP